MSSLVNGVLTIDFAEPTEWKTLYPNIYQVVDGSVPFYVNTTYWYQSHQTLRSGQVSDDSISETTIKFRLSVDGKVELSYGSHCEANGDWLIIEIDGVEEVKISGGNDWKMLSKNLSAGNHILRLVYSKNSSVSYGNDSGVVGCIIFTGVSDTPANSTKYLIRSQDVYYTIVDNQLSQLDQTEINAELFQNYGIDSIPSSDLLISLTNPEVLYWQESTEELPNIVADVSAVPTAQNIICPIDISDASILGIQGVEVTDSEIDGVYVYYAVSTDNETYKAYVNNTWTEVTTLNGGMHGSVLETITYEQWNELLSGYGQFYLRVTLVQDSYVKEIKFTMLNS